MKISADHLEDDAINEEMLECLKITPCQRGFYIPQITYLHVIQPNADYSNLDTFY
jgi:hypothetical protein